jgi:hypothetical protein
MATAPGTVDPERGLTDHDEEFRIEFNTTGPPGPLASKPATVRHLALQARVVGGTGGLKP